MVAIDEILGSLIAREERLQVRTLPAEAVRFAGDGSLEADKDRLGLSEGALAAFARTCGAPPEFVGGLPPEVRSAVLNHLLGRLCRGTAVRVLVTEGTAAAVCHASGPAIRASAALRSLTDSLPEPLRGEDALVTSLEWGALTATVRLVVRGLSGEPRPGDIVSGGLELRVSPAGAEPPELGSFLHRLVCSNGMIVAEPARVRVIATSGVEEALRILSKEASRCWAALAPRLAVLPDLARVEVDLEAEARSLVRALHLPDFLVAVLLEAHEQDELAFQGTPTHWDFVNAVSRVGTHHLALSRAMGRRLMGLAGRLTAEETLSCPRCRRPWLHRGIDARNHNEQRASVPGDVPYEHRAGSAGQGERAVSR